MGLPATTEEILRTVGEAVSSQSLHGCRGGMSSAEVIARLGEPHGIGRRRKQRMTLEYDTRLMIVFERDRLVSMHHDLPQSVPVELVEPLLATLDHQRRRFDEQCSAIDVGCLQLEIVGNSLFAIHLTDRQAQTP